VSGEQWAGSRYSVAGSRGGLWAVSGELENTEKR